MFTLFCLFYHFTKHRSALDCMFLSVAICSDALHCESLPIILDAAVVDICNNKPKFLLPYFPHQDTSTSLSHSRFKFSQVYVSGRFCGSGSQFKVYSAHSLSVLTNIQCFFLLTGIKPESVSRSTT